MNQVYFLCKTHKHCSYLHHLLKQKVFTKVIKMPSQRLRFERQEGRIKVRRSTSTLIETGVEKLT
jgi:hypothetical protein